MRRLILPIIAVVIFAVIFQSYTWDSNAKAVYLFENNGNDDSGNGYQLTPVGTGQVYGTETPIEGTYYFKKETGVNVNDKYWKPPNTLQTYLYNSGSPKHFTIEGWNRHNLVTNYHHPFLVKNGIQNSQGNIEMYGFLYDATQYIFVVKNVAPSATDINVLVPKADFIQKWFHLALTYDGTLLKFYINNVEKASRNDGNAFANNDTTGIQIGGMAYANVTENETWYDRYIFSDTARTSFPTGALDTPTVTPSVTPTATYTATPTATPSATPSVTQTWTQTATQTATPSFTATPTATVTSTAIPRPPSNRVVIGYRIERADNSPRVVYKAVNYGEFFIYDTMYAIRKNLTIQKDGVILIPLY